MDYQGVTGWILQTEYAVCFLFPELLIYDAPTLIFTTYHMAMSNYPFRHSTYYTRDEDEFISELPPMSTEEDILQELQNYERQATTNMYPPHGQRRRIQRVHRNRLATALQALKWKLQNGLRVIAAALRGTR
ncbi:hypothetical protein DFS33DRAFT_1383334 [Desarmillaria ectypa]|nr:hypothetical protein DFS33DRAFT_1383334 [Desarmillaria ectypa]